MPDSYLKTIARLTPPCGCDSVELKGTFSFRKGKRIGKDMVARCTVCRLTYRLTLEEYDELRDAWDKQDLVRRYGGK